MKYCNFCNVNIEDKKVHCPLCGKCLDEDKVKKGIVNHSSIYPDYQIKSNKINLICKIVANSLFILTLICLAIDLLVNYSVGFSLIIVISFFYCYFALIRPLKKRMPMENIFIQLSFFTPLLLLFIELYTKTFGWGINIATPSFLVGISIASVIMMFCKGFTDFDMLKPIIINCILTGVLLILLFAFKQPTLIASISFICSLAIILFMLVFKFKIASKSIKKEFRF